MYQIFWKCYQDGAENELVTVKEHWDASIGFWFASNKPVAGWMGEAISRVFDKGYHNHWSDIDKLMSCVLDEWPKVISQHHAEGGLPVCQDISREYPFEMYVVVVPPKYSGLDIRMKKFNECGEMKAPTAHEDMVEVSWASTTGEISSADVRFDTRLPGTRLDYGALIQPCILCFRKASARSTGDEKQALIAMAERAVCAGEGISACDFKGDFLLIVNTQKIANYQSREWENAPVIRVEKGWHMVMAFCASVGVIDFDQMDVLQGQRLSWEEYFEITAVEDTCIKFTIKIKNSDVKNPEFVLQKGQTQTFSYLSEGEYSYSDGSDFLEEVTSRVTLCWA